MSIAREQLKAFYNLAINHFIFDVGSLPSNWKLFNYVDAYLSSNDISLGYPIFKAHHQSKKSKSDIQKYNTNISDLIFDLVIAYNEMTNQSIKISEFLGGSECQHRGLMKELNKLLFQYGNLLNFETEMYVLGDNFADSSNIDFNRTTAKVDVSSGKIIIGDGASKKLHFGFLENISEPPNLEFLMPYVSRTKLLDSSFSNVLISSNSLWSEYVLTDLLPEFAIRFELPLSRFGKEININRIYINLVSPKAVDITVEYLKDGAWRWIFNNDIESVDVISFSPIVTSKLRFTLRKKSPDAIYGSRSTYSFMIKQIEVYKFDSLNMSELVSTPLRIASNTVEDVAAGEITLEVDENIPAGTQIKYFIAEDPYVTGAFVLETDSSVVVDADYGVGSYFSVGHEDYSEHLWDILESGVDVSGELPNSGEFSWIGIEPHNREDAENTKIYFDYLTESDINEFSDGYVLEIDDVAFTIGKLKLYKIYEWLDPANLVESAVPFKIGVRGGKNCWMFEEKYYEYIQWFEGEGDLVDGECVILGSKENRILNNSIKSIRSAGSLEEFTPIEDYIVVYGVPAYGATIKSNAGKMIAEAEESLPLIYMYGVNMLTPRYIYRCYIDLPWRVYETAKQTDADVPLITVKWWNTGDGKIKSFAITNFDDEMREIEKKVEYEHEHDVIRSINLLDIGRGYGKFKLELDLELSEDVLNMAEGLVQHIINSLDPISRLTLPSYLPPYGWASPLCQVSPDTLKYATHKYDHSRFAIYQHRLGYYALMTNNFGQFFGNSVLVFKNIIVNPETGFIGIDPYDFFDISFNIVNKKCDSFLFKARLTSEGQTTPELRNYKILVRNE